MWKQLMPGLRMTLVLTVLTGLAYPGLVTGTVPALVPETGEREPDRKETGG